MRSTLFIAAATLALSACGGDSGDATGLKSDILLTAACSILQPDFNPTLLKAEALIDGQVVGQDQSAPATATLLPGGGTANLGAGAHTVGCRIVSQTASPTVYEISAGVDATRLGGGTQTINLGPLTKTLATSDVVTFNITVNP